MMNKQLSERVYFTAENFFKMSESDIEDLIYLHDRYNSDDITSKQAKENILKVMSMLADSVLHMICNFDEINEDYIVNNTDVKRLGWPLTNQTPKEQLETSISSLREHFLSNSSTLSRLGKFNKNNMDDKEQHDMCKMVYNDIHQISNDCDYIAEACYRLTSKVFIID